MCRFREAYSLILRAFYDGSGNPGGTDRRLFFSERSCKVPGAGFTGQEGERARTDSRQACAALSRRARERFISRGAANLAILPSTGVERVRTSQFWFARYLFCRRYSALERKEYAHATESCHRCSRSYRVWSLCCEPSRHPGRRRGPHAGVPHTALRRESEVRSAAPCRI